MAGRLPFDPIEEARRQWDRHGWQTAAPGMAMVTSIMRAHQVLLARADAVLRPLGLSFARYEVLMLLRFSSSPSLPQAVVTSRLQVHPTSATNALARLEAAGLVQRAPDPTDRRAVLVSLTAEGRQRADEATEQLNAAVFADPGLDGEGVDAVNQALRALRRAAGDF